MKNNYIPDRNDIIWIDFEPQTGSEINKRRPALVLSRKEYNQFGNVIVCPLTTKIKNRRFEVPIIPDEKSRNPRVILADQIKSFDWRARNAEFKEKINPLIARQVHQLLAILILK